MNYTGLVKIEFKLDLSIKQEGDWYISACHSLGVFSQGKTEDEAKRNLEEAVRMFILSSLRRSTLDEILRECGFNMIKEVSPRETNPSLNIDIPFAFGSTYSEPCPA